MSSILIMPDVPGWACDNIADAVIEHVDFDFTKRFTSKTGLTSQDEDFNLVYIMLMRPALLLLDRFEAKYGRPFRAPVATGFHGVRSLEVPGLEEKLVRFTAVNAVSKELHVLVKRLHRVVYYTPSGVDVNSFKPGKFDDKSFRIKWAGNPLHHWKRAWLLDHLSLKYKIDRAEGYIPAGDMPKFYQGAGAFIIVSRDEGGPLTVLEAAASGIPVVSTNVGIVPELIDEEWIVGDGLYWKMPDMDIVAVFDELLSELKTDSEMRWEVGMWNRRNVELDWTWEKRARGYRKFLEAAMK